MGNFYEEAAKLDSGGPKLVEFSRCRSPRSGPSRSSPTLSLYGSTRSASCASTRSGEYASTQSPLGSQLPRGAPFVRASLSSALVAQLVEHVLGKDGVTGSNPVEGWNQAARCPQARLTL